MSKSKLLLALLACAPLLFASASANAGDRHHHDGRVVRGIISAINYDHMALRLAVHHGDAEFEITVFANDRTHIFDHGSDQRIGFGDLVVGDSIVVGGHVHQRNDRGDRFLLARFIVRL